MAISSNYASISKVTIVTWLAHVSPFFFLNVISLADRIYTKLTVLTIPMLEFAKVILNIAAS